MSKSVYERVVAIIGKELDYDTSYLVLSTQLDSLPMDSLEFVHLLQEFSREFGKAIPDGEAARIETIGDIVHLLEGQHAVCD